MRYPIALLLAATLAAPAAADPIMGPAANATAAPINVNACQLEYSGDNSLASRISGVTIQFTNESAKVADLINFRVDINGQRSLIRDVGTFSSGIEITHKFRAGSDQFALPVVLQQFSGRPPVTCRVESAHFADGSTWQPNAPIASTQGSLSIATMPTRLAFALGDGSRLIYATTTARAPFAMQQNCGGVATVTTVALSDRDEVYRVTPRAKGYCAITLTDAAGASTLIPVVVGP